MKISAIYVRSILSVQFGSILPLLPVTVSVTHRNCFCFICRKNQGRDPVHHGNINHDAPGDDLFEGLHFVLTDKSPAINLVFGALFDLNICRSTIMNLPVLIPSAAYGSTLNAIFSEKFPKIKDDKRKKWLVGAEILAFPR